MLTSYQVLLKYAEPARDDYLAVFLAASINRMILLKNMSNDPKAIRAIPNSKCPEMLYILNGPPGVKNVLSRKLLSKKFFSKNANTKIITEFTQCQFRLFDTTHDDT